MRTSILTLVLLLVWNNATSQEFKVDLSYKYLYSKQWDNAIHTYNFSRPFLTERQPLLTHGFNVTGSYLRASSKKIQHGFNVSYSYCRSSAKNIDLDNTLNLHLLNAGYVLHYGANESGNGLYTDLVVSAAFSGLFRNVNGEALELDESLSNAFGIGGDLNMKFGYYLNLKNKSYLSPFLSVGYTPYLFAPNHEAIINQTKLLASKNWTGILYSQAGIAFHIK